MTDDVVAELNRYLERDETVGFTEMVQRARDEIVALRAKCIELSADRTRQLVADRRAKVLEEAARLCERVPGDPKYGDFFAKAIRALKERH